MVNMSTPVIEIRQSDLLPVKETLNSSRVSVPGMATVYAVTPEEAWGCMMGYASLFIHLEGKRKENEHAARRLQRGLAAAVGEVPDMESMRILANILRKDGLRFEPPAEGDWQLSDDDHVGEDLDD